MSRPDFSFTGRIVHISETRRVGTKNAPVCTVTVDWGDKYPAPTPCECYGDAMVTQSCGMQVGDVVTVEGYVSGREWKGRYYASVKVTQIAIESQAARPTSGAPVAPQQAPTPRDEPAQTSDESLPF